MNQPFRLGIVTVVLLVAMRLAIGWHFFYEGVWKIKHADEFSAKPFLAMAKGPAAPLFHAMIDDLDGRRRLKVEDMATADGLVAAWKKVHVDSQTRYGAYLGRTEKDKKVLEKAGAEFQKATAPLFWQSKEKLQAFLEEHEKDMAAYFAADKRESSEKVATWLSEIRAIEQEYFKALKDYAQKDKDAKEAVGRSAVAAVPKIDENLNIDELIVDDTRLDAEGKKVLDVSVNDPEGKNLLHIRRGIKGDVFLAAWDVLRGDVVRKYGLSEVQEAEVLKVYREFAGGLQRYLAINAEDIDAHFDSLDRFEEEKAAGNNGAAFQQERVWKRTTELRHEVDGWLADVEKMDKAYQDALWRTLTEQQQEQGELPLATTWGDFLDFAVTWGLTAIGLCLLLGFCTRLACLGGVAFLVSVLLTQPPWPTIFPHAPPAAGHALMIDKNFVEMVALLVLASTAVGRWGGLDHFVYRYIGEPLLKRINKQA